MPPIASAGAAGTAGEGSGIEKLGICARLNRQVILASNVALNFDFEVYNDPCVGWTTTLYQVEQARPDYLNVLKAWNSGFWGCKQLGVETFALVWKQPDVLTQGDLNQLITVYMQVLNRDLELDGQNALSPDEVVEMRQALERLGESMVTDSTLDFSHPECLLPPGGEGGAGGAGGAGSGTAGHGGHG